MHIFPRDPSPCAARLSRPAAAFPAQQHHLQPGPGPAAPRVPPVPAAPSRAPSLGAAGGSPATELHGLRLDTDPVLFAFMKALSQSWAVIPDLLP